MKVTPAAAAVSVLLVLLTWLAFRAIDTDAERYDRALKALDRFAMLEIALHRDVLSARAGLLRNYDPLVEEINALRASLGRLRDNASGDGEEAAAIARLVELLDQCGVSHLAIWFCRRRIFGLGLLRLEAFSRGRARGGGHCHVVSPAAKPSPTAIAHCARAGGVDRDYSRPV